MQPGRVLAFSAVAVGLMGLAVLAEFNAPHAPSARLALNRLVHWNLHHRERVRFEIGTGVALMAFVILVTV